MNALFTGEHKYYAEVLWAPWDVCISAYLGSQWSKGNALLSEPKSNHKHHGYESASEPMGLVWFYYFALYEVLSILFESVIFQAGFLGVELDSFRRLEELHMHIEAILFPAYLE
jgi:hypothetical protein